MQNDPEDANHWRREREVGERLARLETNMANTQVQIKHLVEKLADMDRVQHVILTELTELKIAQQMRNKQVQTIVWGGGGGMGVTLGAAIVGAGRVLGWW